MPRELNTSCSCCRGGDAPPKVGSVECCGSSRSCPCALKAGAPDGVQILRWQRGRRFSTAVASVPCGQEITDPDADTETDDSGSVPPDYRFFDLGLAAFSDGYSAGQGGVRGLSCMLGVVVLGLFLSVAASADTRWRRLLEAWSDGYRKGLVRRDDLADVGVTVVTVLEAA